MNLQLCLSRALTSVEEEFFPGEYIAKPNRDFPPRLLVDVLTKHGGCYHFELNDPGCRAARSGRIRLILVMARRTGGERSIGLVSAILVPIALLIAVWKMFTGRRSLGGLAVIVDVSSYRQPMNSNFRS